MGKIQTIKYPTILFSLLGCVVSFAEETKLKFEAAYSISTTDEINRIRVWLVITNISSDKVTVPTANMGPITDLNTVRDEQMVLFRHVPQTLRNGQSLVSSLASFLPVVLGKGESTMIRYTMVIGDFPAPRSIVIHYSVSSELRERFHFLQVDERIVATPTPVF